MKLILCKRKTHRNRGIKSNCCLKPILYQNLCIYPHLFVLISYFLTTFVSPVQGPGGPVRATHACETSWHWWTPTWKSGRGGQRRTKKIVEMMSKPMVDFMRARRNEEEKKKSKKTKVDNIWPRHITFFFGTCRRMCGLVGVDVVLWRAHYEKGQGSIYIS